MSTSIARSLVCATGLVVALGACSTPAMPTAPATPSSQVSDRPDQGATTEQPPPIDTDVAPACTLIGNAEGVSVDLSDVLDLEGGDYFAQVSVPAQGVSSIRGFAGNDEYYPSGDVAVDLDGGPVTVDVVVRSQDGREVYTAQGTATPELNQPNGASYDGENYSLSLLATASGDLTRLPFRSDAPRLDARGRESVVVYTACGIGQLDLDEGSYARVGGILGGPDGPPEGWNAPTSAAGPPATASRWSTPTTPATARPSTATPPRSSSPPASEHRASDGWGGIRSRSGEHLRGQLGHDRGMSARPVTVVTGGGRGIGAATAVHLARAGHDVVVGYRTDAGAAAAVVEAITAAGGRGVAVRCDVRDGDDVEALFAAGAGLGVVTGLVNNAGLTAHLGDLADTPLEVVRYVVDVNLTGALLCARRAAQVMSTARGGVGGAIVNVSSAAATLGSAHEYVYYAAAKAGIDALTVGLAKELADQGVRVNAVAPGMVDTRIHADAGDPDRARRVAARVPMGRVGQPDEIAPAIAWLLGPEAGYVTGAVLRVAGGL